MAKRSSGVGFHKGTLGSPFQLETYGDEGVGGFGEAERTDGPRIGSGVLGRRVTMEVQRDSGRSMRRGKRGDAEE